MGKHLWNPSRLDLPGFQVEFGSQFPLTPFLILKFSLVWTAFVTLLALTVFFTSVRIRRCTIGRYFLGAFVECRSCRWANGANDEFRCVMFCLVRILDTPVSFRRCLAMLGLLLQVPGLFSFCLTRTTPSLIHTNFTRSSVSSFLDTTTNFCVYFMSWLWQKIGNAGGIVETASIKFQYGCFYEIGFGFPDDGIDNDHKYLCLHFWGLGYG